jgi:hypothetical protein
VILLLSQGAVRGAEQPSSPLTRAEKEEFLLKAAVAAERRTAARPYAWRVTLDDGRLKHDAAVEAEDGTTPFRRNCRFNVAAYELDKILELHLVVPSVARVMNGHPASLTWWEDDFAMSEQDRRARRVEPPDTKRWDGQMQAVRLFDELIANRYRKVGPELDSSRADDGPSSHAWGELLILRDWRIALIDHTATFGRRKQLEHPESLTRCDRALLAKLRGLTRETFEQRLATLLSPPQLDALDARRVLLVKHFDEQIARRGEDAVLYDLAPRR